MRTLAGTLRSRLENWRRTKAPRQVLSDIERGHQVPWVRKPSKFHHGVLRVPPQQQQAWAELRDKYVANGAIKPCVCTGYTSRAFLIPKKSGGVRLIVDLRFVNRHVRKFTCRYESLRTLQRLVKAGYYMVSFDLQDAYQCVSMASEDAPFFSFCVDGEYFMCTALPFGYTNSPYVFTKVARHFTRLIRSVPGAGAGAEGPLQLGGADPPFVLAYLDDVLICGKSREACMAAVARVQSVCALLGLKLNLGKCHLQPTQVLEHLGMVVDFARGVFSLTAAREAKVRQQAKGLLMAAARGKRVVPLRAVQSFTGLAQSCKLAVPLTDHFLRRLYTDTAASDLKGRVRLSHGAMQDLKFWVTLAPHNVGAPIWRPPADVRVYTDASSYAYGAVLPDGSQVSVPWVGEELNWHINLQELAAVVRVLRACPHLSHCVLQVCVDNQCVLHWLSSFAARPPQAQQLLRELVELLQERGCVLQPMWVPSHANPADLPSRECRVTAPIALSARGVGRLGAWLGIKVHQGWHQLNQPTQQAAAAVFHRGGPPVLVCLPTGSITRVLQYLWASQQQALILTPWWEAQVWFPGMAGASDWVVKVPGYLRRQFSNLPSAWGRSPLALWAVGPPLPVTS